MRWCSLILRAIRHEQPVANTASDAVPSARAAAQMPSKPRVRILASGWIRHDGAFFPFPPDTFVEVIFEGGVPLGNPVQRAKGWPEAWWEMRAEDPRYNIRFYRLAVYVPAAIDPKGLPL